MKKKKTDWNIVCWRKMRKKHIMGEGDKTITKEGRKGKDILKGDYKLNKQRLEDTVQRLQTCKNKKKTREQPCNDT